MNATIARRLPFSPQRRHQANAAKARAALVKEYQSSKYSPLHGLAMWLRNALRKSSAAFRKHWKLLGGATGAICIMIEIQAPGLVVNVTLWLAVIYIVIRLIDSGWTKHIRAKSAAEVRRILAGVPDDVILGWTRWWRLAGAYNPAKPEKKEGTREGRVPIPKLIAYRKLADGYELLLEFPKGFDPAQAKALQDRLASAMGVMGVTIAPRKADRHTAQMRVRTGDLINNLPARVEWRHVNSPLDVDDVFSGVALGMRLDGTDVLLEFQRSPHLLIGGLTGAGKSANLILIIAGIMRCRQVRMRFIDGKGGVELGLFDEQAEMYAETPEQGLAVLLATAEDVTRRYAKLRQIQKEAKRRIRAGEDVEIPSELPLSDEDPAVFLVVDEVVEFMAALDDRKKIDGGPSDRRLAELALRHIGNQGRAARVHLIAATQRPSAKALDTDGWRANFTSVICGPCKALNDYNIILGPSHGWKMEQLNELKRHRGLRILDDHRGSHMVVTEFIDDKLKGKLSALFPDFDGDPRDVTVKVPPRSSDEVPEFIELAPDACREDEGGTPEWPISEPVTSGNAREVPQGSTSDIRAGSHETPVEHASGTPASARAALDLTFSQYGVAVWGSLLSRHGRQGAVKPSEIADDLTRAFGRPVPRQTVTKVLGRIEDQGYATTNGTGNWYPVP